MEQSYGQFLANQKDKRRSPGYVRSSMRWARSGGARPFCISREPADTSRTKPRFDALMVARTEPTSPSIPSTRQACASTARKPSSVRTSRSLASRARRRHSHDSRTRRRLERQEQMLTSRPTAVLGRLAKETGGFLLENTNDLGAGVARMKVERTTVLSAGLSVDERRARRHVSKDHREGETVEGDVPRALGVCRRREVASRHVIVIRRAPCLRRS